MRAAIHRNPRAAKHIAPIFLSGSERRLIILSGSPRRRAGRRSLSAGVRTACCRCRRRPGRGTPMGPTTPPRGRSLGAHRPWRRSSAISLALARIAVKKTTPLATAIPEPTGDAGVGDDAASAAARQATPTLGRSCRHLLGLRVEAQGYHTYPPDTGPCCMMFAEILSRVLTSRVISCCESEGVDASW